MVNQNNGSINNEGTLSLEQDYTQTGSSTNYSGSGWVWFNGTADQNISSVSTLTVQNLGVDNGNALILGSDLSIDNALDLNNNGQVQLGSNHLTLNTGASISNYDDSHYIQTNSTG